MSKRNASAIPTVGGESTASGVALPGCPSPPVRRSVCPAGKTGSEGVGGAGFEVAAGVPANAAVGKLPESCDHHLGAWNSTRGPTAAKRGIKQRRVLFSIAAVYDLGIGRAAMGNLGSGRKIVLLAFQCHRLARCIQLSLNASHTEHTRRKRLLHMRKPSRARGFSGLPESVIADVRAVSALAGCRLLKALARKMRIDVNVSDTCIRP